jgi:hypothetical protein
LHELLQRQPQYRPQNYPIAVRDNIKTTAMTGSLYAKKKRKKEKRKKERKKTSI